MKVYLLFITFLLVLTYECSTQGEFKLIRFGETEIKPSDVEYLELSAYQDLEEINLDEYVNLKGLKISDFSGEMDFLNELQLEQLEYLYIDDAYKLNYKKLFSKLENSPNFNHLIILDSNLKKLPKKIKKLTALESLRIVENTNINLESLFNQLKEMNSLVELAIPSNDIESIPESIGEIKSIKLLDLSNNLLSELPSNIGELRILEGLKLEGNLILDVPSELEKFKPINLKYLSLDQPISPEDEKEILKMFPGIEIIQPENDVPEHELEDDLDLEENIDVVESLEITESRIEKQEKIEYGTFKVTNTDFELFSDSYLMYPILFSNRYFIGLDTLTFDERYSDFDYAGTRKKRVINDSRFRTSGFLDINDNVGGLYFRKQRFKGKMIFTIEGSTDGMTELRSFNNMFWVYQGDLSTKEFKKQYLNNFFRSSLSRNWNFWNLIRKRHVFNDLKIIQNDAEGDFILEIKGTDKFERIRATPISSNKNIESETKNKTNKRYLKYEKTREKRAKNFNKRLIREIKKRKRVKEKWENERWEILTNLYMSDSEKEMTRQEWLDYYDAVISDELSYLLSSDASIPLLIRSQEIASDNDKLLFDERIFRRTSTLVNARFQTETGKNISVKQVLLFNLDLNSYQEIEGSLSLNSIFLNVRMNERYAIIVETQNGDFAIASIDEIPNSNNSLGGTIESVITLKRISKKIASVEMIRKELGI